MQFLTSCRHSALPQPAAPVKQRSGRLFSALTGLMLFALLAGDVLASGGGSGMPWESALQSVADSITGPVAFTIAVFAFVGAGAMLVWQGGEMGPVLKILLGIVMGVALIVCAAPFLEKAFGVSAGLTELAF